ncbi:MAG: hypothetical protein JXR48_08650 [Candidatus Delongbacteria bacterium]|nr:hypothetical protein [Candidatus Delongbacteria bacterium]MBN2835022.1 hypothetical protein [Candidatus Delongbacteria bacterium]
MTGSFVDIHTHILFDVDDGAISLNQSLEIISAGIAEGVSTFVCTPHFYTTSQFDVNKIAHHFKILKDKSDLLGVNLFCSSEMHFSYDILEMLRFKDFIFPEMTILLEYPFDSLPVNHFSVLEKILNNGYKIIIVHPERIEPFRKEPEILNEMKKIGCRFQITAGSIVGKFGYFIKRFSNYLIKNNLCDFIASDVHNLKYRSFFMNEAYEYVSKKHDIGLANKLFIENPQKLIWSIDV